MKCSKTECGAGQPTLNLQNDIRNGQIVWCMNHIHIKLLLFKK